MVDKLQYESILKQTKAYSDICADFENGKNVHAYMVVTRDNAVGREFAKIIACKALCEKNCGCFDCRVCKNIIKEVNVDFCVYPKKNKKLLVEEVADIINETSLRPIESEKKVIVIANAHEMSAVVQNKLLKTLEEPVSDIIIILICENESAILPTVKSRVRKVEIQNFSVEQIYDFLITMPTQAIKQNKKVIGLNALSEIKAKGSDIELRNEKAKAVAVCADGLIGKACEMFSNDKYSTMLDDVLKVVCDFTAGRQMLEKAQILNKYEKDFAEALGLLQQVFRDALMVRVNTDAIVAKHKIVELKILTANYSTACLIGSIEAVNNAYASLNANLNVVSVIDKLLLDILEERRKCQK